MSDQDGDLIERLMEYTKSQVRVPICGEAALALEAKDAEIARLLNALQYIKTRAGIGLDVRSERVDVLNDIYEVSRDALATAQESDDD